MVIADSFTTVHDIEFDAALGPNDDFPILLEEEESGSLVVGTASVSQLRDDTADLLVIIENPDCERIEARFTAVDADTDRRREVLYRHLQTVEVELAFAVDHENDETVDRLREKVANIKERLASGKPMLILLEGSISHDVTTTRCTD